LKEIKEHQGTSKRLSHSIKGENRMSDLKIEENINSVSEFALPVIYSNQGFKLFKSAKHPLILKLNNRILFLISSKIELQTEVICKMCDNYC
jgi:hypothetical protein